MSTPHRKRMHSYNIPGHACALDFEASLKLEPPIAPGTPDPYVPTKR